MSLRKRLHTLEELVDMQDRAIQALELALAALKAAQREMGHGQQIAFPIQTWPDNGWQQQWGTPQKFPLTLPTITTPAPNLPSQTVPYIGDVQPGVWVNSNTSQLGGSVANNGSSLSHTAGGKTATGVLIQQQEQIYQKQQQLQDMMEKYKQYQQAQEKYGKAGSIH